MNSLLLGIDVGTQAIRVCAFDLQGRKVAGEVVRLSGMCYPGPEMAEQDVNEWWDAALLGLRAVTDTLGNQAKQIVAVSYACTSCTLVALDEKGDPLRPAIMWMDHRAASEADVVFKTNTPTLAYTGNSVSPEWMFPKILWLKNHEPEVVDKTYRLVEQIDYFTFKLTGEWSLGYNHLVSKWNYANPVGGWPAGFLEKIGLDDIQEKFPERILDMGEVVSVIDPDVAKKVGLPSGIPVIQGGMDSTAGMLGLGAFNVGEIGISHGTSTVLQCQSDFILGDEIFSRPDALVKNYYLIGTGQTSTGSVIQWLLDMLSDNVLGDFDKYRQRLEADAIKIQPGSNGLIALEHFRGSRSPVKDSASRGALLGLTLWHKPAHLLHAFYEAIAYNVRANLSLMQNSGYPITRVSAGGGLTNSLLANQILADVTGQSIHLCDENEQTALGAAITAGVGCGAFDNYSKAIHDMVKFSSIIKPQSENSSVYDFYFDKYMKMYPCMKDLMHEVVGYENNNQASLFDD